MNPILEIGQLSKFRHFKLLSEIDFLGVVFKSRVQSFRSYLTVVSYSNDLSLQKMFFLTAKRRTRIHRAIQLSRKNLFDGS